MAAGVPVIFNNGHTCPVIGLGTWKVSYFYILFFIFLATVAYFFRVLEIIIILHIRELVSIYDEKVVRKDTKRKQYVLN